MGAAALPPPMKAKEKVKQGKGTADHLMPLGYLFDFRSRLCDITGGYEYSVVSGVYCMVWGPLEALRGAERVRNGQYLFPCYRYSR